MSKLRVYLYYLGKGETKLDIEGLDPPWTDPSFKEYLSEVKTGILSQFGRETRFLTRDEVLNIVTPCLVRDLPSGSLTQIRFMYLNQPTYFRVVIGKGGDIFARKTRFERMLA